MTIDQILLAIATGLAVSELSEVRPWVARKLVRWSARRRYVPPARAELRAEELTAYIDDRPGGLFKLITAFSFAVTAVVTRKISPGVAPSNPLWWPTTLTVPVHNQDYSGVLGYSKDRAMRHAWYQLTDEVRNAAKEVGVGSRSWRRCIKELGRITGDDRWTLVEKNLDYLEEINKSREKSKTMMSGYVAGRLYVLRWWSVPTDSTIEHYQVAVETGRAEICRPPATSYSVQLLADLPWRRSPGVLPDPVERADMVGV